MVKIERHLDGYNFIADPETGMTVRWGNTLAENPLIAPVPELADISISNHCTKGCSFCYKDSGPNEEFMSVTDYCFVLDSMRHKELGGVFQVALGGGEPLEHPEFIDIIDATVERGIVPNFTTNGMCLTQKICDSIKNKVGAVALSITSVHDVDQEKLQLLMLNSIRTNIHYVLSSANINEAIDILIGKFNEQLKGINALIFLTYKPAGRGNRQLLLHNDSAMREFLALVADGSANRPRIGFDACFVPMLLRSTQIEKNVVDVCEGGFFSVYIDHEMNVSPCSFSGERDRYSLKDYGFYDIWNNKFEEYRQRVNNKCTNGCQEFHNCRGCCPYYPEITLCYEHLY